MTQRNDEAYALLAQGELDEQQVLHYLFTHRDFLPRYQQQLNQLADNTQSDSVTSLWQWRLQRQQQQMDDLRQQMTDMASLAQHNERLLQQLLQLVQQLMVIDEVDALANCLQQWANQQGLLGGYLRLSQTRWPLSKRLATLFALSSAQLTELRNQRLAQQPYYLGRLNPTELAGLLPQLTAAQRQTIGSVAISLLGEQGELGLLIFASERPEHYHSGMAVTFLQQISQVVSSVLARCFAKANLDD